LTRAALELGQLAVLDLGDLVELALALQVRHLRAQLVDLGLDRGAALHRGLLGAQDLVEVGVLRSSRSISSSIRSSRLREASSVSFLTASRSILSWISRRSSRSIDSGLESISILMRAAASSIRSIALSGRKRSVM
jgi:hypothetical protein